MATLFRSSGNLLADRRFSFAADLAAGGDLAAAADLLTQTLDVAPDFASAWYALGDAQERLGQPAAATQSFENARRFDPADRHGAALRLARLGAADAGMPAGYVETLFDQYAARFETSLVGGLAYRGPALLRAAIEKTLPIRAAPSPISAPPSPIVAPPSPPFAHLLDLGCGTGLAGEAFADLAGRLTGVDLSAGMLAAARAKNIYADLVQSDIVAFLSAQAAAMSAIIERDKIHDLSAPSYDLILAADVFAYLADLAPVCAAAARVLAPGGLFAFTVETHADDGIVLGETLRYAHDPAHVRAALDAAGLVLVELADAWARKEADRPAPGLVVVAQSAD